MSRWGIIHTNDFHDRLSPNAASRLAGLVQSFPHPHLVLDAGDCIKAGNLGASLGQERIWDEMRRIGYDAITVGNRETHPMLSVVRGKLAGAPCPILSANQVAKSGNPSLPFTSHICVDRAGHKIGVIGVTIPMVTRRSKMSIAWDTVFESPIETIKGISQSLRSSVDVIVALTHIGIAADRELADAVNEIDIIVSGHSHRLHTEPEVVNGTPILQAGSFGRFAGVATLDGATLVDYSMIALDGTE
jgi:5'-nucleotidase/2',3'-cyclic-nucleotide 2'-phosphodiesterase/3'-nucleotidase